MEPAVGSEEKPALFAEFFEGLARHSARLAGEIAGAWKDVWAIVESVQQSYNFIDFVEFPQGSLAALTSLFEEHAQPFLISPIHSLRDRRPLARVLDAVQEFEASAGEEVLRLPRSISISGADLAMALGDRAVAPMLVRWRNLSRGEREVLLRECAADHVKRLIAARAELDAEATLLLAQASLHVSGLWTAFSTSVLGSLASGGAPELDLAAARRRWMDQSRLYYNRAAQIVERFAGWADAFPAAVARAVLRKPSPLAAGRRAALAERSQKQFTFWARQHRGVEAALNLELRLAEVASGATREVKCALEAVEAERSELAAELHAAVDWLSRSPGAGASNTFPPPGARLAAAEERASTLVRRIGALARAKLPSAIETVQPRHGLPGLARPWRELAPAKVLLDALDRLAAPLLVDAFREAENAHRAVVRQIERAREVVNFGFETAASAGNQDFANEAIVNARSLLEHEKDALPGARPVIENSTVRAEAAVLLETHAALEKSRVGFLAYVTGQRGRAAFARLGEVSGDAARRFALDARSVSRRSSRWLLLKIGWTPPPPKCLECVIERPRLGATLDVDLRMRELPMIYRRLFRLAPVEDARFLVGRDTELAGLASALGRWEAGKGAAVMVVGARGSGKTSLLNCAASSVFASYETVTASFCSRLTTCAAMDKFLHKALRLDGDCEVIEALLSSRRIVILEEFERTFLRTMNGFGAVRRLLDIMYATAHSTLWIFSMNETAYRYLDAVVGLAQHFSYRINAMAVRQEDLSAAILQRHNLSGLRLAFAPPPKEDPRVSRLRRALGFEQDPQSLFLDSLYQESEGIFRSAFELWQRCIERVEGGVAYMRQPLAPDYRELYAELTIDDCFALNAILQHGSLTDEEMARVLRIECTASRRRLERLCSLEILEAETGCPGMRVRPEAGRFVREALGRRRLI